MATRQIPVKISESIEGVAWIDPKGPAVTAINSSQNLRANQVGEPCPNEIIPLIRRVDELFLKRLIHLIQQVDQLFLDEIIPSILPVVEEAGDQEAEGWWESSDRGPRE